MTKAQNIVGTSSGIQEDQRSFEGLETRNFAPVVEKPQTAVESVVQATNQAIALLEKLNISNEVKAAVCKRLEVLKAMNVSHEIIGAFVWLHGRRPLLQGVLEKLGFKWLDERQAWYYCHPSLKNRSLKNPSKKSMSFNAIRKKYPSQVFLAGPPAA